MAHIAEMLANRLLDASAPEESKYYDRSRTWCDRDEDFEEAARALRQLRPTIRALTKTKSL